MVGKIHALLLVSQFPKVCLHSWSLRILFCKGSVYLNRACEHRQRHTAYKTCMPHNSSTQPYVSQGFAKNAPVPKFQRICPQRGEGPVFLSFASHTDPAILWTKTKHVSCICSSDLLVDPRVLTRNKVTTASFDAKLYVKQVWTPTCWLRGTCFENSSRNRTAGDFDDSTSGLFGSRHSMFNDTYQTLNRKPIADVCKTDCLQASLSRTPSSPSCRSIPLTM